MSARARSFRTHPARFAALLLALAPAMLDASEPSPATAPEDALAGSWRGSIGSAQERTEIGAVLERTTEGGLALRVTLPMANYDDLALPGTLRRDGDGFVADALGMTFTPRDGLLELAMDGLEEPARLTRSVALPSTPPMPEPPAGPEPLWQRRLGGQIYASPAVREGVAYVGTTGGVLNAVRTEDGRLLWAYAAGRPILGEALATADAVYFVCDNGYLLKLARKDGKEIWRYDLGDARVDRVLPHPRVFDWDWQAPRPALADGVVFVGSGDGSFHAVDAASGARRWRFASGGKIRTGALVAGARILFGSADRFLYALDRATGALAWKLDTGAAIDTEPIASGERVLVGNRGRGLLAANAATGKIAWTLFFWGSWVESTPVVVDGTVYIGSSDLRRVSAIDPADGRVRWRSDVYGWSWGTPLVVGDRLYVGTAGGAPYFVRHLASYSVLDRSTGKLLRRLPLADPGDAHQWGIAGSPALAGDRVVVATIGGALLALPLEPTP